MGKFVRDALVFSAFCGVLTTAAVAGDRLQITGRYGGHSKSEVLELGKNHVLVTVMSEGMGYFVDPPHDRTPMQHAAGPCRGIVEIKEAVASGRGYCVRINPDGGRWLLSWEVAPDTNKGVHGTWQITGVGGNTVGWRGAGTWNPSIETGEGRFVDTFSGWIGKD
jgi:hypothetical protein